MKYGRNYKLTIGLASTGIDSSAIIITPPLTLTFDVRRGVSCSVQEGTFTIYNLHEHTRKLVYQDRQNLGVFKFIILEAGYGNNLSTIFTGQIRQAFSIRRGVDWVTEITAWDAGTSMANGVTNKTLPAGATKAQVFNQLFSDIPYVASPVITGGLIGTYSRGIVMYGNSWGIAKRLCPPQYNLFIDNNTPFLISYDEYIEGGIPIINSEMGLLETPRREDANLEVKIIFEPRIIIGQAVELQSLETVFNSQYKVVGIHHQGTISDAVCGECTTLLSLWVGAVVLRKVT